MAPKLRKDPRLVELFKKIEGLRNEQVPTERIRTKSGTFTRWDDLEDIWDDGHISIEDHGNMEVAAMEENPSCDEGVDPTYMLSPFLTRKRKGESLPCKGPTIKDRPQKKHDKVDMDGTTKGDGKERKRARKDIKDKDKNADKECEEENGGKLGKLKRLSSSSGRSSKRKELDRIQCEISEMKSKLSRKPSPLTKPYFLETIYIYIFHV